MIVAEGKILKWGNSVGIRISKEDLIGTGFDINDQVEIKIKKKFTTVREAYGLYERKVDTSKALKEIDEDFGDW